MGLDASVMCNCFRDGKITPPPFPLEWLALDAEGYINLKDGFNSDENWSKQYVWQKSCCEHEDMNFVSERISNWTGCRQFQEALEELGWQYFPVLQEELPNANGGKTSSEASAKALQELDAFVSTGEIGTKTVLVDSATGEGLYEYVAAYDGIFILDGTRGINVGIGEFDFFAVDAKSRKDLFRATRIRQFNKSGKKVSGDSDELIWEDLDTGKLFESGIAIHGEQTPWEDGNWEKPDGRCNFKYPSAFHVERQKRLVSDFAFIVQALRTVFQASIKTGNPVRWC
jgi:hypothetical protein